MSDNRAQSDNRAPLRRLLAVVLLAIPLGALVVGATAVADPNEAASAALVDKQRLISLGNLHTCAIQDTGQVRCWGSNDNGQLGNGTTTTSTEPVLVSGLSAVLQLSAGGSHTCALTHGGQIRCWGLNGNGQIGDGSTDDSLTPVTVTGISGATAVASGGFHSCAILGNGTVKCWGNDGAGQLGDGSPGDTSGAPIQVQGIGAGNPARALSLGEFHSCALLDDGTVKCWGHNGFGQLGDGTTDDRSAATPVSGLPDPAVDRVRVVTAGSSHTCVLLDDDNATVRCWGHNAYGSLGHATTVVDDVMQPSPTPLTVRHDTNPDPLIETLAPLTNVTSLTSGQYHTCARRTGGELRCWGNNHRGQLGADPKPLTERTEDSVNAIEVESLGPAVAVSAGGFHTCGLVGATTRCWGYNFYGQLGGYAASNPRPVVVTAVSGATQVAAGTDFACSLVNAAGDTDLPVCWGSNSNGRLGAGLGVAHSTVRVPVSGIPSADAIDAGNGHACALPADSNTPRCWGLGTSGQLGNSATGSESSPVTVSGLTTAASLSAGGAQDSAERGATCAVRANTKVSCWGRNSSGQLGDNSTTDRSAPVTVQIDTDPDPGNTVLADLTGASAVVVGGFHACALMADSSVRCWGENGSGQLGDATTTDRHTAVRVQVDTDPDVDAPLTGVAALAAGAHHTCARMTDDAVRCWGFNGSGQLGDGTFGTRTRPTAAPGFDGSTSAKRAKLLAAGDFHTCATRADGGMSCWGENSSGQLGNGGGGDSANPVQVYGDVPAEANPFITSISASRRNTCARLIDSTVACWGDNSRGQLGDGIGPASLAPVGVTSLPAIGTNHIPNPADDTPTTQPDTAVDVDVLANDTDADGDTLSVTAVGAAAHGSVVDNGDGTVTYTPNAGFCGDDSFSYTVSDGTASVPATVSIEMNCPPVAVNDAASTTEDTAVSVAVLGNDSDPDGDALTVTGIGAPARGMAVTDGATVTYTPKADVCGAPDDTFDYTISDGHGHTATAAITVTIDCANDAPIAADDAVATPEDTDVAVHVLDNDSDVDGDTLSVASVTGPSHGTASTNGITVTYSPAGNYCGPDTFTYAVSDGTATDTGTVTVAVTCGADSPKALDDVASTAEDTSVSVNVLSNDTDPDGDSLSVSSVTDPAHGTATMDGFGNVEYQPDANYCGSDSFSYVVSDGALTDTAVVEVSVDCVNDPPSATDDAAGTPEDTKVHVHVLANDTDADGDTLTVVSATDPAHGGTSLAGDAVAYTPDPDFCGSDSFEYTVRDSSGAVDVGQVFVTVECVNDAPSIHTVADKTAPWGDPITETLGVTDVDAGDSHTFSLVSGPVGATVTPVGGFEWTATASQVGTHTVRVRVTDSAGASSQTSFTVVVTRRAVTLTYSGSSAGEYSDPASVSATLVDAATGDPVSGRSVSFTIGTLNASATTSTTGLAGTSMLLVGPTGDTSVKTAFPGDAAYTAASDSDPFSVAKEAATVRVTGQHLTLASSGTVRLSASVTEEADGYLGTTLGSAKVTFRLLDGTALCTAGVSVSSPGAGVASCDTAALGAGSRAVIASLTAASYAATVDVSAFAVAAPAKGDAAGAGQVGDADDFAFGVTAPKNGPVTGEAVHVFVDGGTAYVVRSDSITSMTRGCSGGSQKVCTVTVHAGSATTVAVNLETGAVSAVTGTSTLRIDATDAAEQTGGGVPPDRYAVAITGDTAHTLGSPDAQELINYGNVRVPN